MTSRAAGHFTTGALQLVDVVAVAAQGAIAPSRQVASPQGRTTHRPKDTSKCSVLVQT
jgi:hypothetical protein